MTPGPDLAGILAAATASDVEAIAREVFDDLQPPVAIRHPAVASAVARLEAAGALAAIMSGSGPTVFALARDAAHAAEIASRAPAPMVAASVGSA
jgi:4-diphosphocytidyl-2-C-methyl-D-erythritol kinase